MSFPIMASHTIDTLAQLIESMGRDLREHREESAASVQRLNDKFDEKLDDLKEELVGTRATEKRVDKLEGAVFGEGDQPGMKGRLETAQRNVAAIIALGVFLATAVFGLVFEWISRLLPGSKS